MPLGRNVAWLLPFGVLVFAVVALPLRILEDGGLPRYHKLKAELVRVDNENAKLEHKLGRLEREIEGLRTDPQAVEHIARDELGMVREGEILFQFAP